MMNLGSILKNRDVTLLTKVHIVKAMVFSVVMYGCELDHKESWARKNWCFGTVVLKKTLESPLDCKEIQSINSLALTFLYSPTLTSIHDYWKAIALTRWTFLSKRMSVLFNMLFRLVIACLPRSKRLLISWLWSPSAMIWGAPQNKVCHCFHCFPIYLPRSDGTGCHDLSFLNVER